MAYDENANTMTIAMTESGLAEINEFESICLTSVQRGCSDRIVRITYAANLTTYAQLGDKDHSNTVTLAWKRTNTAYFDTLSDCCHVYTYTVTDINPTTRDGQNQDTAQPRPADPADLPSLCVRRAAAICGVL